MWWVFIGKFFILSAFIACATHKVYQNLIKIWNLNDYELYYINKPYKSRSSSLQITVRKPTTVQRLQFSQELACIGAVKGWMCSILVIHRCFKLKYLSFVQFELFHHTNSFTKLRVSKCKHLVKAGQENRNSFRGSKYGGKPPSRSCETLPVSLDNLILSIKIWMSTVFQRKWYSYD